MAITMRVALCFDPEVLSRARYRRTLSPADILIFPELMSGGYAAIRRGEPPNTLQGLLLSSVKDASALNPRTVIAGSIFFLDGSSHETNTSFVFRNGKVIHRYDKIHLFKPGGDAEFFRPGELRARSFLLKAKSREIRAGVIICYDLRFPELTRALASQGIHVLFVPARWPRKRDDAWQTLLKARAIENQIFVVGCNARGSEGGYSYVFDPTGKRVFSNRGDYGKLVHTIDLDLGTINVSHQLHHNLNDAVFLKTLLRAKAIR